MKLQVLAQRGLGGYRQYRIPAMAVTPSGRIIVIYDGRADFDDLPGPIDLLMRISDDHGSTWSAQKIFREHQGFSGYGDASIVIDSTFGEGGRIIVLYQATSIAGFFESTIGVDLDDPYVAQIVISKSDDNGSTWQHGFITEQLKDGETQGIFATSGMGSQIKSGRYTGRLLQTFVTRRNDQLLAVIGFSDDHGDTWQLGAEIEDGNETAIAALGNGDILIHSRATPNRLSGFSRDGGMTLETLTSDLSLPDPSDNGSLTTLANDEVICSHNHDQDLRRNTILKKSFDHGATWPVGVLLEKNSSAYSTACELPNNKIGVFFERSAYAELVFAIVEKIDFKPISQLVSADFNEDQIECQLVPRYIRPARQNIISTHLKAPTVPIVDLSIFNIAERKEVGPSGGTTSGEHLYTSAELNEIMGDIQIGLKAGDEVRCSGRIQNHGKSTLRNLQIRNTANSDLITQRLLNPNEKIVFLDLRAVVSTTDLVQGYFEISLDWRADLGKDEKISGRRTERISTTNGLPMNLSTSEQGGQRWI
jgi:sialidase-1